MLLRGWLDDDDDDDGSRKVGGAAAGRRVRKYKAIACIIFIAAPRALRANSVVRTDSL